MVHPAGSQGEAVTSSRPGPDRATRTRIRDELPYPIAISFKRIAACPEADAKRLMYILKTTELTVRLLGIIAVADLRRCLAGRAAPDGDLRRSFPRRFANPTAGTWLWLLRAALATIDTLGCETGPAIGATS